MAFPIHKLNGWRRLITSARDEHTKLIVGLEYEMSFRIRQAIPADSAILARLRYEFRWTRGRPRESEAEFLKRCDDWMGKRLDDKGQWKCWVAEVESQIVGNIWL